MDQKKIGGFLKELRKEKGVTQEQLAERFFVSGRTVSRWETGSNMPDVDILIQLADYYDIELRELLDGERRSENMNEEMRETVLKVADYSNEEKKKLSKKMCVLFILGLIAFTIDLIITQFLSAGNDASNLLGFVYGFTMGFTYGTMILGVLYTSGCLVKIKAFKTAFKKRMFNS